MRIHSKTMQNDPTKKDSRNIDGLLLQGTAKCNKSPLHVSDLFLSKSNKTFHEVAFQNQEFQKKSLDLEETLLSESEEIFNAFEESGEKSISQIQNSIDRLRKQRSQIESIKEDNKRKDKMLMELCRENDHLVNHVEKLKKMESFSKELEEKLKALQSRYEACQLNCEEKKMELLQAFENYNVMEKRLKSVIHRLESTLESERESGKKKVEEYDKKLKYLRMEYDEQRKLYLTLKKQKEESKRETAQLLSLKKVEMEARETELVKELMKATARLEDISRERNSVDKKVDKLQKENFVEKARVKKYEDKKIKIQMALETQKQSYHELQENYDLIQKKCSDLEEHILQDKKRTMNEHETLLQQKKELEVYIKIQSEKLEESSNGIVSLEFKNRHLEDKIELQNSHLQKTITQLEQNKQDEINQVLEQLRVSDADKQSLKEEIVRLKKNFLAERKDRSLWAKARHDLLSQFCDEENKLNDILESKSNIMQHTD